MCCCALDVYEAHQSIAKTSHIFIEPPCTNNFKKQVYKYGVHSDDSKKT